MRIKKIEMGRNPSEILALIALIADRASAFAAILEQIDEDNSDKWSDSVHEYRAMLCDIKDLVGALNYGVATGDIENVGAKEVSLWLQLKPSELDGYFER